MNIARGAMLAAAVLLSSACKEKTRHATVEIETPVVDQTIKDEGDLKWLYGTWKEDGKETWLLFNTDNQVAELFGNPVHVGRKGRLSVHGKYVGVLFDNEDLQLEASPDKRELATSDIRRVYRRGAPP
jgi:hypothetical protein